MRGGGFRPPPQRGRPSADPMGEAVFGRLHKGGGLRPPPFVELFVDGSEAIGLFGYEEALSGSWAIECEPCRFSTTFVVQPRSQYCRPQNGFPD